MVGVRCLSGVESFVPIIESFHNFKTKEKYGYTIRRNVFSDTTLDTNQSHIGPQS